MGGARRFRGRWGVLALASLLVAALAGCGTSGTAGPPRGVAQPTATPVLPPPTATASVPTHDVTFTTPDGVRLDGTLYGSGTTGVVLSHQVNGQQSQWMYFARVLAAHGYLALTFDFRGHGASEGTPDTAKEDIDLRAAVKFLRGQGAKQIALMGASLGGAITLRVAATEPVVAVATLSAVAQWSTQPVTDAIIKAIKAPKLFINSKLDPAAGDTQHMYDVAAAPKAIHLYEGNEHGVALFGGANGDDLDQRLLTFMATYAPATK